MSRVSTWAAAPTLQGVADALPRGLSRQIVGDGTVVIDGMTHDSRRVTPGMLYACVRGGHHDGHEFAPVAVAVGASALLVDHELAVAVPQLLVDDTRLALGAVAAATYGDPSTTMRVVGVTGTNGKTTTTHLLAAILRASGTATGVIGTLSGVHTTPEAPELQGRLAAFRDEGSGAVVMEVSSHALALHRVDGTRFAAAVFTNLGDDHLDLHRTAEDYFRAKASLFSPELASVGVTNLDDAHGRLLFDAAPIEMVGFSAADASDVEVELDRLRFTWRGQRVAAGLGGSFNVMNALAAATAAAVLGVDVATIAAGLAAVEPVPGRFERIAGHGFDVLVDYAHTPDGLEQVITAARHAGGAGRVLLVFGCGGDRDHAKRPRMGAVAAQLADVVVVTSDNPRSEPPLGIIDDVINGMTTTQKAHVSVEPDRAAAIANALGAARDGDVVVIAGKGHETTQIVGTNVLDFDDRQVVRQILGAAS